MRNANGMVVLIILFALIFLLLVLSMPVIVTAYGRFSVRGGVVRIRLLLFGVLPIPLKLRVRLLSPPYLTFRFWKKEHPLLSNRPIAPIDTRVMRLERFDVGVTLGISEDPANTVRSLGLLHGVLSLLLPYAAPRVRVESHPSFTDDVFRVTVHMIGLVYPLFLLLGQTRITERERADTVPKFHEKRYSHVPC